MKELDFSNDAAEFDKLDDETQHFINRHWTNTYSMTNHDPLLNWTEFDQVRPQLGHLFFQNSGKNDLQLL